MTQKSHVRSASGPQVVDSNVGRSRARSSSHRHQRGHESDSGHPKRGSSRRPGRRDTAQQRRNHHVVSDETSVQTRPSFELDLMLQPASCIQLGTPLDISIMLSLRSTVLNERPKSDNVNSSTLIALASLVAETSSGEQVPMDAGAVTGQKLFDSVHPLPEHYQQMLMQHEPCRTALGYFSFPGLVIRQAGVFRIRIALLQMNDPASMGATTIASVDSDLIKVDRRGSGSLRRHQRICY